MATIKIGNKIKQLVIEGRLDEAFSRLLEKKEFTQRDEVLLLFNRYKSFQQEQRSGLLSPSKQDLVINLIKKELLEIILEIENSSVVHNIVLIHNSPIIIIAVVLASVFAVLLFKGPFPLVDKPVEKNDIIAEVIKGRIAYLIDDTMRFRGIHDVEARISKSLSEKVVSSAKADRSKWFEDTIMVGPIMKVCLMDPSADDDKAFSITPLSTEEQIVDTTATTWKWSVTPIRTGKHPLILRATYKLSKDGGEKDIETYKNTVLVFADFGQPTTDFMRRKAWDITSITITSFVTLLAVVLVAVLRRFGVGLKNIVGFFSRVYAFIKRNTKFAAAKKAIPKPKK